MKQPESPDPVARPMLFSGPMVRALLEDRKTMTRRLVKPQPVDGDRIYWDKYAGAFQCGRLRDSENAWRTIQCPHGKPGDQVWVRERWRPWGWHEDNPITIQFQDGSRFETDSDAEGYEDWYQRIAQQATDECASASCPYDGEVYSWGSDDSRCPLRWRPSIFLPRWASRITLDITEVRVEQLQSLSEADAIMEGCEPWAFNEQQPMTSGELGATCPYRSGFACLWDTLHDGDSAATWLANPWVWVISFRRMAR